MRVLDGQQVLVRVFIGESDRWRHQPLGTAIVERLRREGFAGATVFQEIGGFGTRSVFHTAHLLRLSEDLPIVIEIVDSEEHVERLPPILDEMVGEGLVTLKKVWVVKYAPGTRRSEPAFRKKRNEPRGEKSQRGHMACVGTRARGLRCRF